MAEIQHFEEYRRNGEPGEAAAIMGHGDTQHQHTRKITDSIIHATIRYDLFKSALCIISIIFLLFIRNTDSHSSIPPHSPLFPLSSSYTFYDSFIAGECYSPMLES